MRQAGTCSPCLPGGAVVCKGAWRLAAATTSCCRSPVIQNDDSQTAEEMVKGEKKSLKMKDDTY